MNLRLKTGMNIWMVVLALFGAVSAAVSTYSTTQALAEEPVQRSEEEIILDQLIKKLNLDSFQESSAANVEIFVNELRELGIPSQSTWLTRTVMNKAHKPKIFVERLKSYITPRFDLAKAKKTLEWANSPLGRKIRFIDRNAQRPDKIHEQKVYIDILSSFPPEEKRLKIAERLEHNWDLTGYTMRILSPIVKLWLPHRELFMDVRTPELIKRFKDKMHEPLKAGVIFSTLFVYKDLSNKEFEEYADFSESDAGQWYGKVFLKGVTKAFGSQMLRARIELEELLVQIDSDKAGLDLLKQSFPPGERYIALRKRNPFMPLVNDDGVIQKSGPPRTKPVDSADKKRGELLDMPLIPMEVYNKIQEDDPNMLTDLNYYAELFNDKAELRSMDEEEYRETVSRYRSVLLRAQDIGENIIRTSLQVAYDKLNFVGVISSKNKRIALIETEGSKGHSAKIGTLLGPNLGAVEVVREDRIIVIERYRNYLGEVLANKQNIEFSTPQLQG